MHFLRQPGGVRLGWTGDLLAEFQARRGYDLKPYLPALIGDIGPNTGAVRNDWGLTLTELAEEHFVAPLNQWALRHGTRLRAQLYGTPPVASRVTGWWICRGRRLLLEPLHAYPLGYLGRPPARTACRIRRDLDVAAFAGLPRHASGHEGRGGPTVPARSESARRTRMAVFPRDRRRARMALLRCRGLEPAQSLVDRDAGPGRLSSARELSSAPGQGSQRCRGVSALQRCPRLPSRPAARRSARPSSE